MADSKTNGIFEDVNKNLFYVCDSPLCAFEEQRMGKLKVMFDLVTENVDAHILHILPSLYITLNLYIQKIQVTMETQWIKS